MALVPRTASAGSVISTPTPRPLASARVASLGAGRVDEASVSTSTFFDTTPFDYTGGYPQARNDDPPNSPNSHQSPARRNHFGVLNASSEAFASLLEFDSKGEVIDTFGNSHQKNSPSMVSQAINRYEFNSLVVSGSNPVLGKTLSLTL